MNLNNKVTEFLSCIKNLDYIDKQKMNYVLEEISSLDENRKIELLKHIISSSLLKLESLKSKEDKFDCQSMGHTFSEWEISLLNKYDDEDNSVSYWKRTCTQCGLIDVSSINPIEKENRANKL